MADGSKTAKGSRSEHRHQRLAAELRANLGKRKEQARARAGSGDPPKRRDAGRPDKT